MWLAALVGGGCEGNYGTKVRWEDSFEAAVEKARAEGKLVVVMDISGRFEDPGKT